MIKNNLWLILKKMTTAVILILVCNHAHADADVVKFVWNSYCPYTCNPSLDGQPGYAMEIVDKIFRNSKYKAVFSEISSWNRAMLMVGNRDADAIVYTFYPSDASKLYIIPEEAMAMDKYISFVVGKDNPWKLERADSLNNLNRIGIYKDTIWSDGAFTEFEKNHPEKFHYFHGDNISERAFKMLLIGRIDAWEDSEAMLKYQIYSNKINDLRIEQYTLKTVSAGGTLFTRKNPKSEQYADFLSKGIKQLRESGELSKIMAKYGLDVWEMGSGLDNDK